MRSRLPQIAMFALGSCWMPESLYVWVSLYRDSHGRRYEMPLGWAVNLAKAAAERLQPTGIGADALRVREHCEWLILSRRLGSGPRTREKNWPP